MLHGGSVAIRLEGLLNAVTSIRTLIKLIHLKHSSRTSLEKFGKCHSHCFMGQRTEGQLQKSGPSHIKLTNQSLKKQFGES